MRIDAYILYFGQASLFFFFFFFFLNETTNLKFAVFSDSILNSAVIPAENGTQDVPGVQQMFDPSIGTTLDLELAMSPPRSFDNSSVCKDNTSPLTNMHEPISRKLKPKDTSLMDCHDASLLTLQVPESRNGINSAAELQEDILMETVPHINLEEIIEKFTSESNHGFIETESNIGSSVSEKEHRTVGEDSAALQDGLPPAEGSFTNLPDEKPKTGAPSKVTVKVKTSAVITEDSLDEESFYDVLMTYHCKLCSEIFIDKGRLLKHYREVHKSVSTTKLIVYTVLVLVVFMCFDEQVCGLAFISIGILNLSI